MKTKENNSHVITQSQEWSGVVSKQKVLVRQPVTLTTHYSHNLLFRHKLEFWKRRSYLHVLF